MTLTIVLRIGISYKIRVTISLTLVVAPLTRRVMLRPLGVATLLSLSQLFIIRLGVFGTIRVGILNQSCHQLPHVTAVVLEPP